MFQVRHAFERLGVDETNRWVPPSSSAPCHCEGLASWLAPRFLPTTRVE